MGREPVRELGDGTKEDRPCPVQVVGLPRATAIAAGITSAYAVTVGEKGSAGRSASHHAAAVDKTLLQASAASPSRTGEYTPDNRPEELFMVVAGPEFGLFQVTAERQVFGNAPDEWSTWVQRAVDLKQQGQYARAARTLTSLMLNRRPSTRN